MHTKALTEFRLQCLTVNKAFPKRTDKVDGTKLTCSAASNRFVAAVPVADAFFRLFVGAKLAERSPLPPVDFDVP